MYRTEKTPEVGSVAPDFILEDFHGDEVRLSQYKDRINLVLAFYGGESDQYGMRWLSKLSDDYLFFRGMDTDILAISADSVEKARDTVNRYKIPFKLLSDPRKSAIRGYGVLDPLDCGAETSMFIVDRKGKIRYKYICKASGGIPLNDKLIETIRKMA